MNPDGPWGIPANGTWTGPENAAVVAVVAPAASGGHSPGSRRAAEDQTQMVRTMASGSRRTQTMVGHSHNGPTERDCRTPHQHHRQCYHHGNLMVGCLTDKCWHDPNDQRDDCYEGQSTDPGSLAEGRTSSSERSGTREASAVAVGVLEAQTPTGGSKSSPRVRWGWRNQSKGDRGLSHNPNRHRMEHPGTWRATGWKNHGKGPKGTNQPA